MSSSRGDTYHFIVVANESWHLHMFKELSLLARIDISYRQRRSISVICEHPALISSARIGHRDIVGSALAAYSCAKHMATVILCRGCRILLKTAAFEIYSFDGCKDEAWITRK